MLERQKITLKKILNVYTIIGLTLWIIASILIITPIFPQIWYRINPSATSQEVKNLTDNNSTTFKDLLTKYHPGDNNLPPLDPSLPTENRVMITKIGVDSAINEGFDYDTALSKGVWRVGDYGTPSQNNVPIILASHRFGYIWWTAEKRKLVSFYSLPDTQVGDTIDIIWEQRKYTYKIYKAEENSEITDYKADLILYTCKYFNSPVRIFRYAERV